MNDEKYQSYRCRLRENKLKSLRHFICTIHKYNMDVLPVCGASYIGLHRGRDRQVESESFSGSNIVVDGYVICGIILL